MELKELRQKTYNNNVSHKVSKVKKLLNKKHFKNKEDNYANDRLLYQDMRKTMRKEIDEINLCHFLGKGETKLKSICLIETFELDGMRKKPTSLPDLDKE